MRGYRMVAIVCAFNCGLLFDAQAAQLRAGLAKVDITPPATTTYLYGYASRTSPSIGVFDPLHARTVILDDGQRRLALVSLDIGDFRSTRVAHVAKDKHGVGLLMMNVSHTHSGPTFSHGRWDDPARCDALKRQIEDKVIEAIGRAAASMFPARLAIAEGNITLGYHRLVLKPDGRRTPLWVNKERIPIGPVDPAIGIIRIEDTDAGTTRALLVTYACHPVCLGIRDRSISADYPGAMAAKIEKAIPGAICLFAQGAAGDINPQFRAPDDAPPRNWQEAVEMGEFLADEVLRVLPRAQPIAGPTEIQWRRHLLTFGDRWVSTGTVEVQMATVMLNGKIGIAAVGCEPFVQLQLDFKDRAPIEHPLFFGYTTFGDMAWPSYIPDIRSAAEGSYGASYVTKVEIGAGERVVNQAVADLYWMQGMFREKPDRK